MWHRKRYLLRLALYQPPLELQQGSEVEEAWQPRIVHEWRGVDVSCSCSKNAAPNNTHNKLMLVLHRQVSFGFPFPSPQRKKYTNIEKHQTKSLINLSCCQLLELMRNVLLTSPMRENLIALLFPSTILFQTLTKSCERFLKSSLFLCFKASKDLCLHG